ncbi:MAG: hypothetical protein IJG97_04505 [Bacilli bacterium]|nr:hypothetical protein [Bacilli bacterium]
MDLIVLVGAVILLLIGMIVIIRGGKSKKETEIKMDSSTQNIDNNNQNN